MHVYKYLKQKVRRIREQNQKSFKGLSKQKERKTKRLSFIITQFKIEVLLPFTGCRKVLKQKPVQNDKKLCQSHFISQKPYIIWLSFMVQLCKMIMSSVFFYFFKIFIFWVVRGVKGWKMVQNDKKILSVALHITGTIHHMIVIYGANV